MLCFIFFLTKINFPKMDAFLLEGAHLLMKIKSFLYDPEQGLLLSPG